MRGAALESRETAFAYRYHVDITFLGSYGATVSAQDSSTVQNDAPCWPEMQHLEIDDVGQEKRSDKKNRRTWRRNINGS